MLTGHQRMVAATAATGLSVGYIARRRQLPTEDATSPQKTVLVTGGTNGLGWATVRRLASRGDLVFTCGRDPDRVAAANCHENVRAFVCDLAEEQSPQKLLAQVSSELGDRPLDVLVNNAGYCPQGDPVLAISVETLNHVWAVNFRSAVLVTQHSWPLLKSSPAPTIINVGSTASHSKVAGFGFFTYPATKGALCCLSSSLRVEARLLHPRAQVVHLTAGAFDTRLTADIPGLLASRLHSYGYPYAQLAEGMREKMAQSVSLLSPRPPEDFAEALVALVHPACGEDCLQSGYCLNVSLLERLLPWLPENLLEADRLRVRREE